MSTSHTLQALNQPRPIRVQADARGRPVAVYRQSQRIPVESIQDRWRIDDEWWRAEISRMYFAIVLTGGRQTTIFHDLIGGQWFEQMAAIPKQAPEPVRVLVPRPQPAPEPTSADLQDAG